MQTEDNARSAEHYTTPATLVQIKVKNVISPYLMRICEIHGYNDDIDAIGKKLFLVAQKKCNIKEDNAIPKIGDLVVTNSELGLEFNGPAWCCRGIISKIDLLSNKYNILLVDHGICIELKRELFSIVKDNVLAEKDLSCTIGLHGILPVSVTQDGKEIVTEVLDDWCTDAIGFTKTLISSSTAIYFDHLFTDKSDIMYGELYLQLESEVIRLSEALILNRFAIPLDNEIFNFIKDSKRNLNRKLFEATTMTYANTNTRLTCVTGKKTQNAEIENQRHVEAEFETEKVLVYGKHSCKSLISILDAKFPSGIHKAWSSLIKSSRPRKIQSYIWPAWKNGLDVIAIGASKSGKTFGCVVGLTGTLSTIENLPRGKDPSALFFCSSSCEVIRVCSLSAELLQCYGNIKPVAAFNGKSDRSLTAEIFNGCHILVTTPRYLLRYLERNKNILKFNNLRQLIFDDADVIFRKYLDAVIKLKEKHGLVGQQKSATGRPVILQIMITARRWTPDLKKVASALTKDPAIFVGSFLEAAIFKKTTPKLIVCNTRSKKQIVSDMLNEENVKLRTMIACTTATEAKELHEFLLNKYDILVAHEKLHIVNIQDIKHRWEASVAGFYPILIATDQVLFELGITNVDRLIHYSLETRNYFDFRYSTLLNDLKKEQTRCKVIIMVDESNDVQFQSLIGIMQRTKAMISEEILGYIQGIRTRLEKKKHNYPLCNFIKSLGFCPEETSCPFRHYVTPELDSPVTPVHMQDKVKLLVTCIHDATHYSARIVSYTKLETQEEVEFLGKESVECTLKMYEYYSKVENRTRCETVNVGGICTVEESVDDYKRVQICRVVKEEKNGVSEAKYADVRCIDSGLILLKIDVYRLLDIPEELARFPPRVIEVYLSGTVPQDDEYTWSNSAIELVHKWFSKHVNERSYITGKVCIHLGNTMWLETLQVGTKLIKYDDLIDSCLKGELITKGHATENQVHLCQVLKLCKDGGFQELDGRRIDDLIKEFGEIS